MGFILALLGATFQAGEMLFAKKAVQKTHAITIAFFATIWEFLILSIILVITQTSIGFDNNILLIAAAGFAIINAYTRFSTPRALKFSDVGLVTPLMAFVPLFTLFTGMLFLKETPGTLGLMGIVLIIVGTYILKIGKSKDMRMPIKRILKEKGMLIMLANTLLRAFSNIIAKEGITTASVLSFMRQASLMMIIFQILFVYKKIDTQILKTDIKYIIGNSTSKLLADYFILRSYQYIFVVYSLSIKRMGSIFAILGGKVFFKEKETQKRLFASILMILGTAAIAFS